MRLRGAVDVIDNRAVALSPIALPAEGEPWLGFVESHSASCLGAAREAIERLKDGAPRSAAQVLTLWNDLAIHLRRVEGLSEFLAGVHPDAAVREAADEAERQFYRLQTGRDLDRGLYDVLRAVDANDLDDGARRVLDQSLRDFRRAGVDQTDEVRDQLRLISERCTELCQEYLHNITDDVRTVLVAAGRMQGLPAEFIASHPVDANGMVTLTTEYPDAFPVRTFAVDDGLRHDLCRELENRGWPANEPVLLELLRLRQEQAQLLGYPSRAEFDAEVNMVGSATVVTDFLEQLAELAEPVARRELDALLARRRLDDPSATSLRREDQYHYYAEQVRRDRFGVNGAQVREYFEFSRVRTGLLDLTARLFGLDYRERPDAPVWHEDVMVYDVYLDNAADLLGRLYLDLHPREGKYTHAAMWTLMSGVEGRHLPEVAVVTNFPRGQLDHGDVTETFLHELGHALHSLLGGRQPWLRFSGAPAVELDFAEAPSQLLEEWAWSADVLRTFAVDRSGNPIPRELVERMRAAQEFGRGLFVLKDVVWSATALKLYDGEVTDPDALATALRRKYDVFEPMPDVHSHASLTHLAEYASAYYTYPWSMVISKDLFSAFDADDLFARAVADRYRDRVLVPGGSREANRLVEDFLGRPRSLQTFHRWLTGEPLDAAGLAVAAED
jgi:thimet oligopeptidase